MATAKGWKQGKKIELTTAAQITAWRERLDTEIKGQKAKNEAEIEKMQDKLDMKNTYLHQFKKDEVKERELVEEQTCTHVNIILTVIFPKIYSSNMIWLKATPNKTTAKSANTSPSGANTERRERSLSKNSEPLLPRKVYMYLIYIFSIALNSMDGERITTTSVSATIV